MPPVVVSTKFLSLTLTADNRFVPCNFMSLHRSASLKVGELLVYLSNSWEERLGEFVSLEMYRKAVVGKTSPTESNSLRNPSSIKSCEDAGLANPRGGTRVIMHPRWVLHAAVPPGTESQVGTISHRNPPRGLKQHGSAGVPGAVVSH